MKTTWKTFEEKRLSYEAETGLSRPNYKWMVMMMMQYSISILVKQKRPKHVGEYQCMINHILSVCITCFVHKCEYLKNDPHHEAQ